MAVGDLVRHDLVAVRGRIPRHHGARPWRHPAQGRTWLWLAPSVRRKMTWTSWSTTTTTYTPHKVAHLLPTITPRWCFPPVLLCSSLASHHSLFAKCEIVLCPSPYVLHIKVKLNCSKMGWFLLADWRSFGRVGEHPRKESARPWKPSLSQCNLVFPLH
jgi:hypothetical protein